MKINIKHIIASLTLIGSSLGLVSAQDNITMVAENLPQSMLVNPALRPDRKFLSIPLIGSFSIGPESSFSYNSIIKKDGAGVKFLDTQSLVNSLSGNDLVMLRANIDLVNVGFFLTPHDYMSVSMRTRVHVATSMPEDLFSLLLDNPIDKYRNFDMKMTPNMIGWNELGVSYTRDIDKNWRVGGRVKYLAGAVAFQSSGIHFNMDKQYDRYILSGDYNVKAGNYDLSSNSNDKGKAMIDGIYQNPGVGFDVGVSFVSNDKKWRANASISDIGVIFWNAANSSQIQVKDPSKKYDYTGLGNLKGLTNGTTDIGGLLDSVYNDFSRTVGVDTISGGFSTWIPATFQAAGNYAIDKYARHNVNVGFIGTLPYKGHFQYAISAGYSYHTVNGMWQLMANYTYKSNNPLNLGLGVVFSAGCFQAFMTTDDVISAFSLASSRGMTARLGLNFFLGSKRMSKRAAKW